MATAVIQLDKPHSHFTNLDYITGKVVLKLSSDTSISAIHVKLEGESRTRLSRPRDDRDKKRNELEVHKILYRVNSVFPSPDVAQHSSPNAAFTFAPGVYQYPFQFKFPFNNACNDHNSMMTNLSMIGLRVEVARDATIHVKKTLPPSLNTFPGEAEIKYYVKATVVRPQFFKENIRTIAGFNFLPIEPPRSGNPNEETYARRQQEFARTFVQTNQKSGGLFRKKSMPVMSPVPGEVPPRVSVDARLPNPPILTCNEPIPLRLLITKQSPSPATIYLQLIQIELIGYTRIRAHDLARTEALSTLILSRSNMNMAIGPGTDPVGKQWKVDPSMWNRLPIPPIVAPSFETCNISRNYELEVRVGLAHSSAGNMMSQVLVLPLRLSVKVYSGIRPPPALLEAMAADKKARASQPQRPSIPTETPPPQPPRPVNPQSSVAELDGDFGDDAPPSYEDAMAEHIAPIDGPRGDYQSPAPSQERNVSATAVDAKTPIEPQQGSQGGIYASSSLSRSSSESLDMLPQTPRSRRGSMAESLLEDTGKNTTAGSSTRQDPIAEDSQQPLPNSQDQPGPSQPRPRNFSTGVPNRRPVPGSSQTS